MSHGAAVSDEIGVEGVTFDTPFVCRLDPEGKDSMRDFEGGIEGRLCILRGDGEGGVLLRGDVLAASKRREEEVLPPLRRFLCEEKVGPCWCWGVLEKVRLL